MYVAMGSGIALALVYDVNNPYDSLQIIMLSNPGATFIRGIHYWSSQLFLILTALHFVDQLSGNRESKVSIKSWLQVSFILPTLMFLMVSGFILKGDRAGLLARQVLGGLLGTLPLGGNILRFLLLGNSNTLQVVYLHHIATATLIILVLTLRHGERVWPEVKSLVCVLGLSMIISTIFMPGLMPEGPGVHVKGPWYFVGLQEILHWTTKPVWIVVLGISGFALFCSLPFLPRTYSSVVKRSMVACLAIYLGLTVIGIFFRGPEWQFILPWEKP